MTRYLVLLLLLSLPVQAATIYKWTDEQGRTHFSSEPPPRGQSAERIPVKRAPPTPAAATKKATPAAEGDFRRLEAKAKRAQAPASSAYRQRKCSEAEQAKLQLQTAEAAEAEDAQRQAALKIAQRDIRRWCE